MNSDKPSSVFTYDESRGEEQLIGRGSGQGTITEVIRTGGIGRVFVLKRHDGTRLVLKTVPREHRRDIKLVKRFSREARLWFLLPPHPNIVTAKHYVEICGRPFIEMDYFTNGDLEGYRERTPHSFTAQFAYKVALQICDAINHSRNWGVKFHGDLKPKNILVSDDGQTVLLSDFGLARAQDEGLLYESLDSLTWQSPKFAAPEVRAKRELTLQSDVYSLGLILHWLLAYDVPQQMAGGLTLDKGLSKRAQMLIHECCKANPEERLPNFEVLRKELEALYEAELNCSAPSPLPPSEKDAHFLRWLQVSEVLGTVGDPSAALHAIELAETDSLVTDSAFFKGLLLMSKAKCLIWLRQFPKAKQCALEASRLLVDSKDLYEKSLLYLKKAETPPHLLREYCFSWGFSDPETKQFLARMSQSMDAKDFKAVLDLTQELKRYLGGDTDFGFVYAGNAAAALGLCEVLPKIRTTH